ncbi:MULTISPECIES: mannose-1-phosphate guanylyltransferase/mannose-6-phosphate isomerase [Halocynthiibacter]|uniref:mannose-1-phosphate guanylyltransferase n=1 Tax=Halocynthiibacter halioticoli TaxID=2986804 RepID=A0AAE3LP65_9RHOB|nr:MULTISPECIES: mannose-1-phosphate guanylyltransferase/mannose-6-phosphate isomerase [Halocynthiibacter]MCV6823002.1 mannose-1-phosphate guanylyltransferase/mannose-6-phosphate isomerase [Halocynthiibacter halioticoli]MCW4056003.1 mannose-1-phosphate guanylyltransferase/mannose-6-phosphate isomerase [Halocynthiibacter sp. SDUM655004]
MVPVVLAGGSGTRLWPLSRKSYPKQFSKLLGEDTLLQSTLRRFKSNECIEFAPPTVMTHSDFRFIVKEQMDEIIPECGPIFLEPFGKNTAPSVLAAAYHHAALNLDALLLVAPSDHAISDYEAFHASISKGLHAAREGHLVTFGVTPTRPETGYGYLNIGDSSATSPVARVDAFVEKPDIAIATEMVASKKFLWNSGMFLFKAKAIIQAFETHAPQMCEAVRLAVRSARRDLDFLRLDEAHWREVKSISIDYAVMEKADNLFAVRYSADWSDLGGWDAVWREASKDKYGVATSENAHAIECQNTLLRSENAGQKIVGIGLTNILAVAMPDAVLVADMSRAQDVKRAVDVLLKHASQQAQVFPKEHRPWGWFESLVIGARFQVKRIQVKPGASLSLQSHYMRSEHWIVVEGTAQVTVDGKTELVSENQSVYVPLGSKHRLENPGKLPMVLIEVQTGPYVGEDDIVRFDDAYARV